VPEVVAVQHVAGHRIHVRFDDGAEGEYDVSEGLPFEGIQAALANPAYVALVRIDPGCGTVAWPNGFDICPDLLYLAVQARPRGRPR
jgi:hypothetical protein